MAGAVGGYYNNVTGQAIVPANTSNVYGPITLSHEYSKIYRILFLVVISIWSSIFNVYLIMNFVIEKTLRCKGNIFLVSAGVADLIVSVIIMPMSAAVIVTEYWDNVQVCRAMQMLTSISTSIYSNSILMVALNTYIRICCSWRIYKFFTSKCIILPITLIYTSSIVMAVLGVYYKLDYDYCGREHFGDMNFMTINMSFFHINPVVMSCILLFRSSYFIQRRVINNNDNYPNSVMHFADSIIVNLNLLSVVIYVSMWLPYVVNMFFNLQIENAKFYTCAWIGLFRVAFMSCIYGLISQDFRRAFMFVVRYICCIHSERRWFVLYPRDTLRDRQQNLRNYMLRQLQLPPYNFRGSIPENDLVRETPRWDTRRGTV